MVTDKYLISVEDMKRVHPMAEELSADRINPHILMSQSHDLRNVLGEALYYDFLNKFDQTGDTSYTKYQELLNGKVYSYNGYDQQYEGLVEMICFFALARFIPFNDWHTTKTGNRRKLNPSSEPIPSEDVQQMVTSMKANATFHIPKVRQFLQSNNSIYPLYNYGAKENLNKLSVKWFDPDIL